ncbi:hypothetical protein B0H66DRAFT_606910 [Apodospora peruviana]|uniref:NAD(P)-binding domain-containing protein n=1 Tax=Apodospora peruviana TaxID=516989 RepID=A0AAE0LZT7_9PEZI|nr:hypothetical protein B0H66DRAFT_606910 [Apodospora peruviana]
MSHRSTLNLCSLCCPTAESIHKIFERESNQAASPGNANGIWGVFVVLMYPGFGAKDDQVELKQGKAFVYSSIIPPGPKDEDFLDPSHRDKRDIERYCEGLAGLNWIIVRPGFFMENFDGFLGSVAVNVLGLGLSKDATVALIASKDIGNVVAGVFRVRGLPDETESKIAAQVVDGEMLSWCVASWIQILS